MRYSCLTCGSPLDVNVITTKPKTYCSSDCRDYQKYKNALERSILKIHPSRSHSKLIRGDMFRLANLLRNSTNFLENK